MRVSGRVGTSQLCLIFLVYGRMRLLWTLSVVPRPDASFMGLMVVTLASFLAFQNVPVEILGRSLSPLQLSLAVFFFTSIARNLILNGRIWKEDTGKLVGIFSAILVVTALFWISSSVAAQTLQLAYSAYTLAYATLVLAIVTWDQNGVASIPSIWARDPRFAVPTLTIVAIGDAVFAISLAAIAFFGSEAIWVLTMTLGAVATKYFVNWINVLLVIVRLDDES